MQGIVSILRSDNPKAAPLRRTLSADMSSKKWLPENGFPAMKKIASSEHIAIIDSDEEECEVINEKADENPRRIDIWTAIMSQKNQEDSSKLPPPYVHPLVKKSASSLSEKSLKVCTESLGSETGSDVFSYTSSKSVGDNQVQEDLDEHKVVKVPCLMTKKAQHARSLPPPLPSLAAARTDGSSLQMHSRRVDGRLVVEAVSIPPQKYFEAQRQDGRFLLTLINDPKEQPSEHDLEDVFMNEDVFGVKEDVFVSLKEDVFNIFEEEKPQDDNHIHEKETLLENNEISVGNSCFRRISDGKSLSQKWQFSSSGDEDDIHNHFSDKHIGILKDRRRLNWTTTAVINVNKSTVTIKRIIERDNENPSWSAKLNMKVGNITKLEAPITQSLPPRPRATRRPPLPTPPTTTLVNSYQYFWRAKPTEATLIDPLTTQHRPPTKTKDLVLLPSFKGCKEARRSLVMWEPFCIATS